MSMSSYICGVRDLDGKFAKMAKIKEACDDADIKYPEELKAYFKYPGESIEYLRQEMEEMDLSCAVTQRSENATDIFEVDLSKLPKEVKIIRFKTATRED